MLQNYSHINSELFWGIVGWVILPILGYMGVGYWGIGGGGVGHVLYSLPWIPIFSSNTSLCSDPNVEKIKHSNLRGTVF